MPNGVFLYFGLARPDELRHYAQVQGPNAPRGHRNLTCCKYSFLWDTLHTAPSHTLQAFAAFCRFGTSSTCSAAIKYTNRQEDGQYCSGHDDKVHEVVSRSGNDSTCRPVMVDVGYDLSCSLGQVALFAPECIPGMLQNILQDYKEVLSYGILSPGLTPLGCLSGCQCPLFWWQYQRVSPMGYLVRFWLHLT